MNIQQKIDMLKIEKSVIFINHILQFFNEKESTKANYLTNLMQELNNYYSTEKIIIENFTLFYKSRDLEHVDINTFTVKKIDNNSVYATIDIMQQILVKNITNTIRKLLTK